MSCPICCSAQIVPLAGPQRKWRYRRCGACGHMALSPMPSDADLATYYNSTYRVPPEWYRENTERQFPAIRRALTASPARVLEIGCSYGHMLAMFRDAGWQVEGVELDARAAEFARNALGLTVHTGRAEEIDGQFEAVIMSHVLEHITEPRALLAHVQRILVSGGILVLRTPNADSLARRIAAGWWEWCATPEHVHLYTLRSLDRLLASVNLQVNYAETRRGDANTLVYELVRGGGRRLLRRKNAEAAPSSPGATRRSRLHLFNRLARPALQQLGRPLDGLVYAAASSVGPELLVRAINEVPGNDGSGPSVHG